MKLPQDPRLPILGGQDYERSLYQRLYELFRTIAQCVNDGADIATGNTEAIAENATAIEANATAITENATAIAAQGLDIAEFSANAQWYGKAIGEPFGLRDDIAGVAVPPTNNPNFRFIRLTASDAYNSGVLTSETVSGSAPNVVASAVISLAGSPLNGKTVNLLNTERRFLRAGSSGTLENDDYKSHNHPPQGGAGKAAFMSNTYPDLLGGGTTGSGYVGVAYAMGATGNSGGTETKPRNQGITLYMRIK